MHKMNCRFLVLCLLIGTTTDASSGTRALRPPSPLHLLLDRPSTAGGGKLSRASVLGNFASAKYHVNE